MPEREPRTIMVVKLRTLGDVLTTFPLLRALKERYPRARLVMVADEQYQDLFSFHPRVDAFWPHPAKALKERGGWFAFRQNAAFIRRLRSERIDMYIDLYGSLRTALWGALAGIPVRLGFNLRGRKYFYNRRIIAACRYVVDLNLQFARRLGWQGTDNRLEFFLTAQDMEAGRLHLQTYGRQPEQPLLVVSPGGGWPVKCWSPEKFGAVAGRLAKETGCQVVLSGSSSEEPLVSRCGRALGGNYIPALGLPLRHLAAIISRSRLFLGNDSGPKYFAEAFQVPTLICYGPTDFLNNNPDRPRHRVVYLTRDCRPCHSEACWQSRRQCLDDLSEDQVFACALKLWQDQEAEREK